MTKRYRKYKKSDEDWAGIVTLVLLCLIGPVVKFISENWLLILIFFFLALIIFLIVKYRDRIKNIYFEHYTQKLRDNSKLYVNIQDINAKYKLDELKDFIDYYSMRNKRDLDDSNIDEYLMMTINNKSDELVKYKKKYDYLKQEYNLYLQEYETLKKYIDDEEAKKLKMPIKKYYEYHEKLYNDEKIKRNYRFQVVIYINYKSDKGKVKKSIYKTYKPDEFLKVKNEYDNLKRENKLYEISGRIERRKMTNSMRYDVLKRDNYRCIICGKGRYDGVKLEVDHIVPVSKGGKTEISNLQTLCDRCNSGKSNKY